MQNKGKFIVIYGSNNLGKSTQVKKLATKLITELSKQVLVIKYPIYGLKPTGPKINAILRGSKHKVSDFKLQQYYAQNRRDFQNTIKALLAAGVFVLAEDYTGTGLAWGMTRGVSYSDLKKINKGLIIPDVAILIDGKRFKKGVEKNHRNERAGDEIWNKNRNIHLKLAKKLSWKTVNANQSIKKVHEDIIKVIENIFNS